MPISVSVYGGPREPGRVPRKLSHLQRTSLYRLTCIASLSDGIQTTKYENGDFTTAKLTVGRRAAFSSFPRWTTPTISWAAKLHRLTGQPGNITARRRAAHPRTGKRCGNPPKARRLSPIGLTGD